MKKVLVIGDVIEDTIVISKGKRQLNTDNPSSIKATPGGSGANAAVWLASLGVEVELIAHVAVRDKERLEEYFKSKNVTPRFQIDEDLETGRIVVVVEGNNRTFYTDRGANSKLSTLQMSECDLLFISGYSVISLGKENTQSVITTAKAAGSLVAVDPGSSSFITSFGAANFLEAISGADILFPNLEEHQILGGVSDLTSFPELVVTKGDQGAELVGIGHVVAQKAEVLDPTGAGDAFAAMYLSERLLGTTPIESLEKANKFAAKAISQIGGQPN